MSKKFLIAGSIVDTDADRWTFEDVTPTQVNAFLKTLDDSEELEIDITSFGGSVTAGLAICNMLKQASAEGHKITAHVIGIAASMASAIACACDELKIDANAFLMVHNPYTVMMGNANDMRKEADNLDMFRDALLAIYRTKFDAGDETIKKMLDDETWILGEQAELFKMKAEVIPTSEPLKIAASLKIPKFFGKFNHTPNALRENIMENKIEDEVKADAVALDETEHVEEVKEVSAEVKTEEHLEQLAKDVDDLEKEVADKVQDEKPVDETTEKVEEPVKDSVEEFVPKAEVEKRVSGMQSAMAKQMNDLKKDYEAKIEDFNNQLNAKSKELIDAQAKITSLEDSVGTLTKDKSELSEKISALMAESEERKNALDMLNASVNTPNENVKDWRSLKGKEFFDFVKEHPELVKKN